MPCATRATSRKSSMRPLVHEPMNTRSSLMSVMLVPGVEPHVGERPLHRFALALVGDLLGVRHRALDRHHVLGAGAPGDDRRQPGGVELHLAVEVRALVRFAASSSISSPGPRRRPWAISAGPRGRRRSSRRAPPCRRARRPRSTCCRRSCGPPWRARGWPRRQYSMTWPVPPAVPISPMMDRMMSLAVTPSGSLPSTVTRMFLAFLCVSVWVASTCSTSLVPMPMRQRAEGAVRGGVAVAADDGRARQGEALLRPDHVHDALPHVALVVIFDAEILGVAGHGLDLDAAFLVLDAQVAVGGGGDVVVDDGQASSRARAPCAWPS